ncbi:hypothetical protein JAO10_31215 [Burkholderia contaminans]|nr:MULTISPECIES: hypothetical protein [Burkholderia cepacia complex]MBH9724804.1 hypothetical protein [Burkholderia contaminans]MBR8094163.1 hypothetical protein [Burkholderia cenocepacia]MBY4710647.1 hypothetical protein [Burkholderia cepacia]MBY4737171.1 hypothetical protein [Burkholderia cepacia]MBY4744509.1 hypothetical protein [Burkholderia cepacia]
MMTSRATSCTLPDQSQKNFFRLVHRSDEATARHTVHQLVSNLWDAGTSFGFERASYVVSLLNVMGLRLSSGRGHRIAYHAELPREAAVLSAKRREDVWRGSF